jgi:hypothetical protein
MEPYARSPCVLTSRRIEPFPPFIFSFNPEAEYCFIERDNKNFLKYKKTISAENNAKII